MRRFGWPAAIALVLLANVALLLGAWWNRSGEPEVPAELTERELRLVHGDDEDSGLSLRLVWRSPEESEEEPGWFDAAKLEAVGYDCSLPLEDPSAEIFYTRRLPREAWVVLEYAGPAWEKWREQEERALAEELEEMRKLERPGAEIEKKREAGEKSIRYASRLLAVDAGRDAGVLRSLYPDPGRHLVVRAVVRLRYERPRDLETKALRTPFLRGRVQEVLVNGIHVPRARRAILDAVRKEKPARSWRGADLGKEPRYRVRLRYGRRREPWVVEVLPIGAESGSPGRIEGPPSS